MALSYLSSTYQMLERTPNVNPKDFAIHIGVVESITGNSFIPLLRRNIALLKRYTALLRRPTALLIHHVVIWPS